VLAIDSMSVSAAAQGYPHVYRDPTVAGGEPVIEGSRIPVTALVRAHQLGMDFDEILLQYPGLTPAHLHAAFLYYLDHEDEVETLLKQAETVAPGAEIIPE
jgi:uncharacterized protein (DUF433 family)